MGWSSRAGGAQAKSLAGRTGIANDDIAGRADVHLMAGRYVGAVQEAQTRNLPPPSHVCTPTGQPDPS